MCTCDIVADTPRKKHRTVCGSSEQTRHGKSWMYVNWGAHGPGLVWDEKRLQDCESKTWQRNKEMHVKISVNAWADTTYLEKQVCQISMLVSGSTSLLCGSVYPSNTRTNLASAGEKKLAGPFGVENESSTVTYVCIRRSPSGAPDAF